MTDHITEEQYNEPMQFHPNTDLFLSEGLRLAQSEDERRFFRRMAKLVHNTEKVGDLVDLCKGDTEAIRKYNLD